MPIFHILSLYCIKRYIKIIKGISMNKNRIPKIRRYRIIKDEIMLSFLTDQDHNDFFYGPKSNIVLESDGHTIWASKGEERHETITSPGLIECWIAEGKIEEIKS